MKRLPPIMRERLVRFRHAMHIFFLLHGPAARIRRIDQFVRELVHHGLARALPRILQQPANRQRLPAERVYFHGNLVVRATHAPRLYFQQRLHVLDGFLENFQRIVVGLIRHLIHRAVKHALRRRLLAFPHHRTDELLHDVAGVDRIGRLRSPENESFAWHGSLSLLRKSFHAQALSLHLTSPARPWVASRRTLIVPACGSLRPRRPQGAQTKCRESAVPVLKGLLRIRRYHQQETPYALQEVEPIPWIQFGEAYSALRGWRPIPAALLSHSVLLCSGTEDISLPTQRLQTSWSRPTQGKFFPDKHRSIGNKSRPVKSFATIVKKTLWKSIT